MEKISIVRRRHRSRELETAALLRARLRERNNRLDTVPPQTTWTASLPVSIGTEEELCFEIELTPEQVHWLQQHRREEDGDSNSSPEKPVIFRFNLKHPGNSETLTSREVCKLLKISRRTLYRFVKARQIPAFRVGGSLRFLRQDVVRFLSQNRIES